MSNIPNFTIRQMLEAGVHFGHKKNRWNPQMAQFIYGSKGDLHVIDLSKTYYLLNKVLEILSNVSSNNGKILFVGTKRQSSSTIAEYAAKCKQHYVNHRWLGGMLTNWSTVSNSIKTLNYIEEELGKEDSDLTKKEKLQLSRKQEKLNRSLGGIKELRGKPSIVIIFDTNKESIAVQEAVKLNIPVIAIVDTNSSLENVTYPIPGNDDSAKATSFFCNLFAETIIKSRGVIEEAPQEKEVVKKAADSTKAKASETVTKVEEPAAKEAVETKAKKEADKPAAKKAVAKPAAKKVAAKPAAKKATPVKKEEAKEKKAAATTKKAAAPKKEAEKAGTKAAGDAA